MCPVRFRHRFSLIADDLVASRAKLFIFFRGGSFCKARIFYSKYLCCKDVGKSFKLSWPTFLHDCEPNRAAITTLFRRGRQPSICVSN